VIADEALRSAVERSYEAFAQEARPTQWRAAPSRDGDTLLHALTSVPLRDLGAEVIGPYAGWAMTTVGSERDYRHFLPRILELAACDGTWLGAEPTVIAGKLKRGAWEDWDETQRAAVLAVFEAGFCASIDAEPGDGFTAVAWLCGLAALDVAVEPRLARWAGSTSSNAALQLSHFIRLENWPLDPTVGVSCGFWEEVSPILRRQIADWLTGGAVRGMVEAALDLVEPEDRWEIEQALDDLGVTAG
jgi:hypothetical protein